MTPRSLTKLLLVFMTASLIGVSGCDRLHEIEPSGRAVKVVVLGPFSGEDRAKGKDGLRGIEIGRSLEPLLANGDVVELLEMDDRNHPETTATALAQAAQNMEVAAVLLLSSSDAALAVGDLADALQIPVLALVATHTQVTREREFISQLGFDNEFQGRVAALFVRDELLLEKAAVIRNEQNAYSSQLAAEFGRMFENVGGVVTEIASVQKQATDYAELMVRLNSLGTEMLYLPVSAEDMTEILKAVDDSDWSPVLMAGDGLLADALTLYPEDASILEGMYATDFFGRNMIPTEYGNEAIDAFLSRFGDTGSSYSGLGAEGYRVLRVAMSRCENPLDRQCVGRMIRDTRGLEGVAGRLSIGADGKSDRPVVVNTIKGGKLEFVVKVY